MKRIPFAAALALGLFALARADEGAYKNLVGMAQAAPEPGPEADDAPTDAAPKMGTLRDAVADVPTRRLGASARFVSPFAPASEPVAPRLWTKLYSTLLPSWRRPAPLASSYDAPVSTGPVAVRAARLVSSRAPLGALMPPPDSEAVSAGERRGLAELMSVADPAAQ